VIDEDADRDAWLADNGWAVVGTEETTVRAALSATVAGA
jgi:very-short-patch-repair endonuclease